MAAGQTATNSRSLHPLRGKNAGRKINDEFMAYIDGARCSSDVGACAARIDDVVVGIATDAVRET